MNTPKLRYSFQSARPPRTARRLLWTSALTAAAIVAAACVAARAAEGDMPPTALRAMGVCEGLRAGGAISRHRPIAVTVLEAGGAASLFRCDPVASGKWLAPVSRVVSWR